MSTLSQTAIDALRSQVTGTLLLPGDSRYEEAKKPWLRVVDQQPALVIEAENTDDVVLGLGFAQAHGLPVGVQNTGHGIAKACDGGVLLKLNKLKKIDLDAPNQQVRVGAGVEWGTLLKQTQAHGLVAPAGQVSSVGVVGYTLGGGTGWLVRKYGTASEYLLAATVVLASGEVVRASATERPDLWWALRGGGGNFGVVVEIELALVAEPDEMLAGLRWYPGRRVAELLPAYRDWAAQLAPATSSVFRVMQVPDESMFPASIRGQVACVVGLCHADAATQAAVQKSLDVFGEPALDQVSRMPYAAVAALDPASHESSARTYDQTAYLQDLSDATISLLLDVARTSIPPLFQLEVQQLSHPAAAVPGPPPAQAFATPTAPFMLHFVTPIDAHNEADAVRATREAFGRLAPVLTGERCYNFLRGDEQAEVPRAFPESAFARLRAVKRQVDPQNVFRLNLNIEPATT